MWTWWMCCSRACLVLKKGWPSDRKQAGTGQWKSLCTALRFRGMSLSCRAVWADPMCLATACQGLRKDGEGHAPQLYYLVPFSIAAFTASNRLLYAFSFSDFAGGIPCSSDSSCVSETNQS